ncbi:ATP-binding protein [Limibaculum sp. M0105]|uniref:ATP-binding protein n=1 Tax=Thermohalobaculum xanthum TaxID=2753746 RepID=A0A8J7M3S0_9RHOB|nr:ATP-binding protein [Thermohalobaculum xanthum]MBK0397619.1 ATP-binding protein [Thermohalobaculum xanthum]
MPCQHPDAVPAVVARAPDFELAIANDIRAVPGAVDRTISAAGFCDALSLGGGAVPGGGLAAGSGAEDIAADLRLALAEALNNVVEHGGGPASVTVIRLRLWREAERLTICIEDDGPPVPAERLEPHGPERAAVDFASCDLDSLPEGGWGLMLIAASVDRVHRHRGAGCNLLFLEKRLPETIRAT